MNLPESIQVGPFRYGVSAEQKLEGDRWGHCDANWRIITLAKDMPPRQQSVTLLHEIIHAADDVFNIDLKEHQVQVLAHSLAQALSSMGAWPEKFE
ncbi:MAG: hypothetical protein IH822_06320 [Chloroflexi bacterium]|nr:hypothetical protein [Chloroflexota bacterium]